MGERFALVFVLGYYVGRIVEKKGGVQKIINNFLNIFVRLREIYNDEKSHVGNRQNSFEIVLQELHTKWKFKQTVRKKLRLTLKELYLKQKVRHSMKLTLRELLTVIHKKNFELVIEEILSLPRIE